MARTDPMKFCLLFYKYISISFVHFQLFISEQLSINYFELCDNDDSLQFCKYSSANIYRTTVFQLSIALNIAKSTCNTKRWNKIIETIRTSRIPTCETRYEFLNYLRRYSKPRTIIFPISSTLRAPRIRNPRLGINRGSNSVCNRYRRSKM